MRMHQLVPTPKRWEKMQQQLQHIKTDISNFILIIEPDEYLYYRLAAVYDKLGRYQESLEACKQATRIEPDNAGPHYNLALVYRRLGRYQDAIETSDG